MYFAPPLKGFPSELGTDTRDQQTRMMGLLGPERSLMVASAIWIQCTNMTDRQMDGHRATAKTALMHSIAL